MDIASSLPGKIITFYSYKGGTGRSMALANTACLLARRLAKTSLRILVIDWDLEAPGLHRFFAAKSDRPEYELRPGLINYFSELQIRLLQSPALFESLQPFDGWKVLDATLSLEHFVIPDVVVGVDFMRAGRFDSDYAKLVGTFNWIEFFERYGAVIRAFRELLVSQYGYCLIDSRTGVTDVSGICTTLLPEKLVGVFTPNRQSLHGLADVAAQAINYRSRSEDFRPLSVFPLPSRVENAEEDLKREWRQNYQQRFEDLFRQGYDSEQCDLTAYFDDVLLPHVPYYAYGENIAVLQERSDALSLSKAYERFFDRLINFDSAWEKPGLPEEALTTAAAPTPITAAEEKFDAFFTYTQSDVAAVELLESRLREYGLKPFFDKRDLLPGVDLIDSLSSAMEASKTILVCIGPSGVPSPQTEDTQLGLERLARDPTKRIIPLLLPGTGDPSNLRLPTFLGRLNFVDFRSGFKDEQTWSNLIWSITGERPKPPRRRLSKGQRWLFRACVVFSAVVIAVAAFWAYSNGYIEVAAAHMAAAMNSNDSAAHERLALALFAQSNYDGAFAEYREAIRLKPNDERLHFHFAQMLAFDKHDLDGAITQYRESIRIHPDYYMWHQLLADIFEEKGDLQGALDEYRTASKLDPNDSDSAAGVKRLTDKWEKYQVQVETLKAKLPRLNTGRVPLGKESTSQAFNLKAWAQSPPKNAWCYQEEKPAGHFSAHCHWSVDRCNNAKRASAIATNCEIVQNPESTGWRPNRAGFDGSWYELNLRRPLPKPFPQFK